MTTINDLSRSIAEILRHAYDARIASSLSFFLKLGYIDSNPQIILHHGITAKSPQIITNDATIYDLASLTKILGTTLSIARLSHELNLKHQPFWPGVSLQDMLAHRAGLKAHIKFYEELNFSCKNFTQNKQQVFAKLFSLTPSSDRSRVYSDLDFMALGFFLELYYKKPLFEIFLDSWKALNIEHDFQYFASKPSHYVIDAKNVAATGYCPRRQKIIRAQVHDRNCYFMGGMAGHAGLFSTMDSIKRMGQFFLKAVKNPTSPTDLVISSLAHSGWGFDKPDAQGTNRYLSENAFGHFGFTGTSLWIDPRAYENQGIIIALLTNRVNCSERPEGIFHLRLKINRAINEWHTQYRPDQTG